MVNMKEIKLVAEIGINHNGSIDLAKKLIDVAVDTGCHYVKFQKRDIDLVYSKDELDLPRESPWGNTNRDQKRGLEFGLKEYGEIERHCRIRGIDWFVSCWDTNSVDFIEKNFSVSYHKVASALLTDRIFLEKLRSTNKKIILSTGMSSNEQINEACKLLAPYLDTVLHCTSTYPTKPEEMNISGLKALKDLLRDNEKTENVSLGFSNHYSGLLWVPLAIAYGAEMLEFHITLDRTMYGSDQSASLEPEGVRKLVEMVTVSQQMIGDGIKKVYDSELPIIKKLRKRIDY